MPRANPETRLQIVVVEYLRLVLPPDAVVWSVPNGGKMTEAARKLQAAMGEQPGVSDVMFLWNGRLHCIECKLRKSEAYGIPRTTHQSPAQRAFESALVAAGGVYEVCRHTDDVRAALAFWRVPTREVAT